MEAEGGNQIVESPLGWTGAMVMPARGPVSSRGVWGDTGVILIETNLEADKQALDQQPLRGGTLSAPQPRGQEPHTHPVPLGTQRTR